MVEKSFLKIDQPIGSMYLTKLCAKTVYEISASRERKSYNDNTGIQRKLDNNRVSSIAKFCKSKDAMFPTPIILSASSDTFKINEKESLIEIPNDLKSNNLCSVIDGQHRLEGIIESKNEENFELFVLFVFDTDPSKDAYLFSIINGNQKPVSKSLIYDLYGLSKSRTIEKLCNKVMQILNNESYLEGKIKMLGYKDQYSSDGIVSQAALINHLIPLITNDPKRDDLDIEYGNYLKKLDSNKYILRDYFINNNDEKIIEINVIFFNSWISALYDIKGKLLNRELTIFEKTIGFSVSYKILQLLYLQRKEYFDEEELLKNVLKDIFSKFFIYETKDKIYSSSESGVNELYLDLVYIMLNRNIINKEIVNVVLTKNQLIKLIEKTKNPNEKV